MTPEYLAEFIDVTETCVMSSVDQEGFPQTRAMLGARHREGIEKLYFTTNTSSSKVQQFKANEKASIYLYDPIKFV
jgi:general stress protein 26